jgi:hypothetical protein
MVAMVDGSVADGGRGGDASNGGNGSTLASFGDLWQSAGSGFLISDGGEDEPEFSIC